MASKKSPSNKKELRKEFEQGEVEDLTQEKTWQNLKALMASIEAGVIKPATYGSIGYHEKRAIRFAYCVMGWHPSKIAANIGRHANTVNSIIVRHKMKRLRERIEERLISDACRGLEKGVETVVGLSTRAIEKWLGRCLQTDRELTPKDIKLISDVGANYHRILQLIRGDPTNINRNLEEMTEESAQETLITALKRMREDPMCDFAKTLNELGINPTDAGLKEIDWDGDVH